jgi:small subunit ribosomal protein S6
VATNNYETVFIAEPEISTDQVEQLIGKIKQTIGSHSGTVTNEDRWGRRRMAYPIAGHREGFYTVITYTADSAVVTGLEHLFNVSDTVIRHMTTRVIKKTKKFAPRRERTTSAVESGRPAYRTSGPSRRPDSRPPSAPSTAPAPAAASAATPAAAPAPAPAQVAETPATPPASEGTKPA